GSRQNLPIGQRGDATARRDASGQLVCGPPACALELPARRFEDVESRHRIAGPHQACPHRHAHIAEANDGNRRLRDDCGLVAHRRTPRIEIAGFQNRCMGRNGKHFGLAQVPQQWMMFAGRSAAEHARMEFGILVTSHPNTDTEPYPHRGVHVRVTSEILRADELGYDTAWLAEHHFSNEYGIMPDVFVYAGYLAGLTRRIRIGTAVVTLPLANPVRVAENAAFLDILSAGRFVLGLGSGYRKYEFDGFGVDFEQRRDIQEEALPLLLELFHDKRTSHHGKH